MPILQVGATAIPYTITESPRARRQRIVVTNSIVEVVVPAGTADDKIIDFLHRRRRWVFDTRARMLEAGTSANGPQRYVSGAKVLYRGRQVRLRIHHAACDRVTVVYRNGFEVAVPVGLGAVEQDAQVEAALTQWLKDRLWEDVAVILDRTCKRLGLEARGFRLRDQKHLWGSCSKDGMIYLNWHLVRAPKPVLEYAVVHEVCHLRYRSHSAAFWALVASVLPSFNEARRLLNKFGVGALQGRSNG